MAILQTTGKTKKKSCNVCSKLVKHELFEVLDSTNKYWIASEHLAKCRKPCLGGGIEPEKILPNKVHDLDCECKTIKEKYEKP